MILTSTFIAALKFANHASSRKDIRHYLMGVLFEFRGNRLHLAGTNGASLATITLELSDALPYDADLIIDNDAVKQIVNAYGKDKRGAVTFTIELNEDRKKPPVLTIEAASIKIQPKPIDGHFPDWRRIIPPADRQCGAPPALDASLLGKACEAVKLIAGTKGPGTQPVRIEPGAGIADAVRVRPALVHLAQVSDCLVMIAPVRE